MEPAGHLVAATTELPACVEDGVDDLHGVRTGGVLAHRDAASVVLDGDRVIAVDRDGDVGRVTRHRFVDRVVDDLPDQVMEATDVGRPDVHARPATNSFEPLEDLNAGRVVVGAAAAAAASGGHTPAPTMRS